MRERREKKKERELIPFYLFITFLDFMIFGFVSAFGLHSEHLYFVSI